MKLFSRTPGPDAERATLVEHLGGRPRILATGKTAEGALFALFDRLAIVRGEEVTELGWHDVLTGGWNAEESSMHWTRMSDGAQFEVKLDDPGQFPGVFKERVESTFLFRQVIHAKPGKALTVSARRNLMDDKERVLWTVHPARGVRMDEETIAFAEAELARLRAEYAF